MTIWIDADACPVVGPAIAMAKRHGIECVLLCDTAHRMEREGARTIIVSKGADSVDFALVNMVRADDIVITQDYGLAAMCLARKSKVLNQNGLVYTDSNMDSLLAQRHTSKQLRAAGIRTKGPAKRTAEQDDAFIAALKQLLS